MKTSSLLLFRVIIDFNNVVLHCLDNQSGAITKTWRGSDFPVVRLELYFFQNKVVRWHAWWLERIKEFNWKLNCLILVDNGVNESER